MPSAVFSTTVPEGSDNFTTEIMTEFGMQGSENLENIKSSLNMPHECYV